MSDHRTIETGTTVVHIAVRDAIGLITLNRPERRNALHRDMYAPIRAALTDFATADDVTCIVVTGAGEAFCAGGDVRDGRRREPSGDEEDTSDTAGENGSDGEKAGGDAGEGAEGQAADEADTPEMARRRQKIDDLVGPPDPGFTFYRKLGEYWT